MMKDMSYDRHSRRSRLFIASALPSATSSLFWGAGIVAVLLIGAVRLSDVRKDFHRPRLFKGERANRHAGAAHRAQEFGDRAVVGRLNFYFDRHAVVHVRGGNRGNAGNGPDACDEQLVRPVYGDLILQEACVVPVEAIWRTQR